MDYKIQLYSFIVSFLFGIFFFVTNFFNNKLIQKKKWYFKYTITFLYMLNLALIYIVIIFKINQGIFHIYFLIMVLVGYLLAFWQKNSVKKYVKWVESHIKLSKKML